MRKKNTVIATLAIALSFVACGGDDSDSSEKEVMPLGKIDNVSLNYHSSSQQVVLPRDVESEGAIVSLKDGVGWISGLTLHGNTISFQVVENTEKDRGHRFDTIVVSSSNKRIGTICVSQARVPISSTRLAWALSEAEYRNHALLDGELSGKKITEAIYKLSKITGGIDNYHNYPAFEYCIEMNHDPENNMEWHLPSIEEMYKYEHMQSFESTPFGKHNYWWSASEGVTDLAYSLDSHTSAARGGESKGLQWWVMAFRNGKMVE